MIGDKPSAPLTWPHVALIGAVLAATILLCLICGWTAGVVAGALR